MYDNPYILLSPLLDFTSDEILDSEGLVIEGRLYSDLLAKFLEGIPEEFEVNENLRDNDIDGVFGIQDYIEDPIRDSNSKDLEGKSYSSKKILDSGNNKIPCRAVFIYKNLERWNNRNENYRLSKSN